MEKKLVSLESPYAGDIARNTIYAQRALRDSIIRGEAPLASHLIYPQVLNEHDPEERNLGIILGYAWMNWADAVVFYTDYGWSSGMIAARNKAAELEIEIIERQIGLNP